MAFLIVVGVFFVEAPCAITVALVYRVYLRIFDPGPSNPTTFLGLCSLGDYRQSIVSNGRPHLQLYRKVTYIH